MRLKNYGIWLQFCEVSYLLDNSPTDQLTVTRVVDWSTHGLVNSPTVIF